MTNIDSIKEKLRKLIAKEISARELGNLAEAEAFATKIGQLMLTYELEMDDVMKGQGKRVYNVEHEIINTDNLVNTHETNWAVRLYQACSASCFCYTSQYVGRHADPPGPHWVIIFGDTANRELLQYMVTAIANKLRPISRTYWNAYEGPTKRNTFIRSFFSGAVNAISIKLKAQRAYEEKNREQVAGLILNKMGAVSAYIKDWTGESGATHSKSKPRNPSSYEGYRAGYKAGENMNLNKGVPGSNKNTELLN